MTVAARDDLRADRGLNGDLELLPRDDFLQRLDDLASLALDAVAMSDERHRVDFLAVDEDVELDERRRLEPQELVVERGITAAHGLQPIEEIEHHLGQRQFELDLHLPARILHSFLLAALLDAQLDDRAEILLRHENARENDRLADLASLLGSGKSAGFSTLMTSSVVVSTS